MSKINIKDIRIGDVIELIGGKEVEVTSVSVMTGDTVGFKITPTSKMETTVDISGVVRIVKHID